MRTADLLVVHGHRDLAESLRRVRAAERIWANTVVFSGRGEAAFMYAMWRGIADEVLVEDASVCTRSNVAYVKPLVVHRAPVVAVTSWWHTPRAGRLWAEAGVHVEMVAAPGSARYLLYEVSALRRQRDVTG